MAHSKGQVVFVRGGWMAHSKDRLFLGMRDWAGVFSGAPRPSGARIGGIEVLLDVGVAVAVSVGRAVGRFGGVEAVLAFPFVRHAVAIGVDGRRAGGKHRPAADVLLGIDDLPGAGTNLPHDAGVDCIAAGRVAPAPVRSFSKTVSTGSVVHGAIGNGASMRTADLALPIISQLSWLARMRRRDGCRRHRVWSCPFRRR